MSRTVEEFQRVLASVPADWIVAPSKWGVFCVDSPDGQDRICVMPWPTPDSAFQERRFVRVPPLGPDWPDTSYRPIDVWLDGGRTVAKSGEWEVSPYRNRWRWFVIATAESPEVKGIANSRFEALGAVVHALWERSAAKIREQAGPEDVPF